MEHLRITGSRQGTIKGSSYVITMKIMEFNHHSRQVMPGGCVLLQGQTFLEMKHFPAKIILLGEKILIATLASYSQLR